MDVSGWTIEQRSRFPDWCFGPRQIIGVNVYNNQPDTHEFGISEIALPDPAMIWELGCWNLITGTESGYCRAGLAHTKPETPAEMDTATEIYPYFGTPATGPNIFPYTSGFPMIINFNMRRAMATDSKKLVVQNSCLVLRCRIQVSLIVSELPTSMAGWLAHNP